MKQKFIYFVIFALLFSFISGYAEVKESNSKSLETILLEIRSELEISGVGAIDPANVSEGKLEELGESIMNFMFPETVQREYMDEMMGGEGSETLTGMHKALGYQYLSGSDNLMECDNPMFNNYRRYMPMMGTYGSMMGNSGWGGMTFGFGGIIMWILIIGVVGLVVYLLVKSSNAGGNLGSILSGETALDILEKRYASGELSDEDFEQMKRNLE